MEASFSLFQPKAFGATHQGLVRGENQDAYFISPESGLYAIADGIGGMPGGANASKKALHALNRAIIENPLMTPGELLQQSHQAVYRLGKVLSPKYGIGTTLTAIYHPSARRYVLLHVGDSICLLIRHNQMETLSEDHVTERVHIVGQETSYAPALSSFVGQKGSLEYQAREVDLQAGDKLLLLTDGITKCISEEEILTITNVQKDPENLVQALITMANLRGGYDNATALALFMPDKSS